MAVAMETEHHLNRKAMFSTRPFQKGSFVDFDASSLHAERILYVVQLMGSIKRLSYLANVCVSKCTLVIISGPCGRLARVCRNFKSGTGSKQKERESSKSELSI